MKYTDDDYNKTHDILLFNRFWFTELDGLWLGYDDNSKNLLVNVQGTAHPYSILEITNCSIWKENNIVLNSYQLNDNGNVELHLTMDVEFFPDMIKIPEDGFNSIDEFHLWLELQK